MPVHTGEARETNVIPRAPDSARGFLGRLRDQLAKPILAPLLRRRSIAVILGVCGVLQIALSWTHMALLPCPMLNVLHVPCPGCGITRAIHLLLVGNVTASLHLHAFAGFFLLAAMLFAFSGLLHDSPRLTLIRHVERIERRTLVAPILLCLIILYWLARLVYSASSFTSLMRGS